MVLIQFFARWGLLRGRRRPAALISCPASGGVGPFARVRAGGMALIQFFAGNATLELGLFNAKAMNERSAVSRVYSTQKQ